MQLSIRQLGRSSRRRLLRQTLEQPISNVSLGRLVEVGATAGAVVAFTQVFILMWWFARVPWIVSLPYSFVIAFPAGALIGAIAASLTARCFDPSMRVKRIVLLTAAGTYIGAAAAFIAGGNEEFQGFVNAPLGACAGFLVASIILIIAYRLQRKRPL